MAEAKRDGNYVPTLLAVSSTDGVTPVVLYADPTTHRLYVDLPGNSGTVRDIKYNGSTIVTAATFIDFTGVSVTPSGSGAIVVPGNTFSPLTNTADYIPQWNGADSQTLKNGLAVPAGGLAGLTALGGKEDVANKATTFVTINDTLYPTVKAVNDAIVTAVVGLLDYRGSYDASTNLFPATGGSGIAGAILKGDFWICSVAGTLGGTPVVAGDMIIALIDTPAQTAANWDLIEHDFGYTPENTSNKVTSISGASTDVQYPSAKLLYDQLATKGAGTVTAVSVASANGVSGSSSGGATPALTIALGAITPSTVTPSTGVVLGAGITTTLTLPTVDGSATGNITGSFNSGYSSSAIGDLVYLDSSSTWQKCDATSTVLLYSGLIGIALEVKAAANALKVALAGSFIYTTAWSGLTVGGIVYMSSAGAITQTAPSATDNATRVVGWAVASNKIFFNPSSDYITHV